MSSLLIIVIFILICEPIIVHLDYPKPHPMYHKMMMSMKPEKMMTMSEMMKIKYQTENQMPTIITVDEEVTPEYKPKPTPYPDPDIESLLPDVYAMELKQDCEREEKEKKKKPNDDDDYSGGGFKPIYDVSTTFRTYQMTTYPHMISIVL